MSYDFSMGCKLPRRGAIKGSLEISGQCWTTGTRNCCTQPELRRIYRPVVAELFEIFGDPILRRAAEHFGAIHDLL